MFTALMLFDWSCSYDGKEETTEEEVKEYIRDGWGDKLASMFKPEYLDQQPNFLRSSSVNVPVYALTSNALK